jgi:hypothetical protein
MMRYLGADEAGGSDDSGLGFFHDLARLDLHRHPSYRGCE